MKKILLVFSIIIATIQLRGQLIDDWRTSGMTTVQGTIIDYEKYYKEFNLVEIQVPDWTNGRRRTYFSQIDSNGNFSFSFFIFNTQQVIFIYKNIWPGICVSPNDTLKMTINADIFPNGIEYHGKTSIASKTMNVFSDSLHQIVFKESDSRFNQKLKDSLNFADYKSWRDSIYNLEMKRTKDFIQNIKPESYLIQWFTSLIQLRCYRDFLSILNLKDTRSSEERIADLFSRINSINTDTLQYDLRISPFYSSIVNSLYSNVFLLARIYQSKDHPLLPNNGIEKITATKNSSEDKTMMNKKLFYSYYVKASNVIRNVHLRESVLAHYYSNVLESQNIDLGLDSTLMLISDPEIRASLVNTFNSNQWRKANQNSLKVNLDKPTILDNLREKYKGYVLYIDIWGTWCGPCYTGLKYAPAIKKAFQNQKVAFVYLCSTCNKEKWEKDINEYKLDGEHLFLTSDQNATLSKEFNIFGVPRYIIMDKNGKIVNDNALGPWPTELMQKKLIDELSRYLNAE